MDLRVNDRLSIPEGELRWAFTTSGGPGGQQNQTSPFGAGCATGGGGGFGGFGAAATAGPYVLPGVYTVALVVDGKTVYRTGDFAPGNVEEKITWDDSGRTVTFTALGLKFTYDTETDFGTKE